MSNLVRTGPGKITSPSSQILGYPDLYLHKVPLRLFWHSLVAMHRSFSWNTSILVSIGLQFAEMVV